MKCNLSEFSIEDLIAELEKRGYEVHRPHPTTLARRKQRTNRTFPVISRSGRSYVATNGRLYGEISPNQQRQADAGYWRVGEAIRAANLPMTVAVAGTVERIYEVNSWSPHGDKWVAALGALLTDNDLDTRYPDYPYRYGDDCPTRNGGAYRPETY
ncbi:hypothetical protein [Nocardia lasii]|uniref:Uncharacterized protein n=1 Tax=Nocardia lasii TaxID=1616107 RepID=A0ABW1JVY1_9NOCA